MTAPNERLADFHPLPKGLYRDKRYGKLSLSAARLLVDAHMLADDGESDGVATEAQFMALGAFAKLGGECVESAIAELINAEFLGEQDDEEYALIGFRGLSHQEWERRRSEKAAGRAVARERQRRRRARLTGDSEDEDAPE